MHQGHVELVQFLLEKGANVSAIFPNRGFSLLELAAHHGNEAVALLLLQHGADVSERDNNGLTALHTAAFIGRDAVVQVLIEHRANVSAEDINGRTPQDLATSRGHIQVVGMLKAAAVTRAKCVAFAMGHHKRLGMGSRVEGLDPEVLRMVLEQV